MTRDERRQFFDTLPDNHVITLGEVEVVPAVLGRGVPWSYSHTNGVLTAISAHDLPIRTAGDLRAVLMQHPRREESDVDPMAQAIGEALAPIIARVRDGIVWNRIRIRALTEILTEQNSGLLEAVEERIRQVAKRDYEAFMNLIAESPEDAKLLNKDWSSQERQRIESLVGVDTARRIVDAWDEWARGKASAE